MTSPLPAERFGERLKRLRLERGLSQRQIAAAGVSYAYISRLEAGTRSPSVRAIRTLARRLGVTPEYLETGIDIPPGEALELRLADAELRLRLGDHGAEAHEALEGVLTDALTAAEAELVVRAQIALGLSSLAAGGHHEAIEHLAAAEAAPQTSPMTHASVYISLAKAYQFTGRPEAAVELLDAALDELVARAPGDAATRLRLSTYLTYALTDMGDLERAREVIRASSGDMATSDPRGQVRLIWSLARLTYMEGRPRSAVREMRRAIGLLDLTEDSLELARAHLFCVEVSLWGGDLVAAEVHLPEASQLKRLPADERDLAALTSCEALLHARHRRFEKARQEALHALAGLADAPAEQGIALTALGLAAAGEGDVIAARDAFEAAIDALVLSGELREASLVFGEWSTILRKAGLLEEADEVAERAVELADRASSDAFGRQRR